MTICLAVVILVLAGTVSADLNNGLVAYYPFNGNADDSVGNNNGTVYGAQWTAGYIDGALSFDGDGDYVEIADDDSLDLTGGATLAAWINTNSLTTWQGIVGRWNFAGSPDKESILLDLGPDLDNKLWFWISTDGTDSTTTNVTSNLQLTNTWYHVVATYDATTMRLYVNGQEENSTPKSGNIFVSDTEWNIGACNYGGTPANNHQKSFFNGLIDDVRIYDRALSSTEVTELYNIPEPATLLLLGLGVVTLRRKR